MMRILPLLRLALGAASALLSAGCGSMAMDPEDHSNGAVIAKSPSGQTTSSQQVQQLKNQGVVENPGATSDSAGLSATKNPAVDPSKKFEYVDVYTSLGDPEGMRALAKYFLEPDVWTLIKCEMLSDTSKHYRFQRLSTGEGRVMPKVDIFKDRR